MNKIRRLLRYILPYKGLIAANVFFNVFLSIFTIASVPAIIPFLQILFKQTPKIQEPVEWSGIANILPWVQWQFSKNIMIYGESKAVWYVVGGIVALFFLSNLCRYFSLFFIAPVRVGVIRDLRNALYKKMLSLPLSYFSEERKGDLMARMTADVQEVEWSILSVLEALVREPIILIGTLSYMLWVNPGLTIYAFVMILLVGTSIGLLTRSLKRKSTRTQQKLGDVLTIIEETLGGLRIVKAFNADKHFEKRFVNENNTHGRLMVNIMRRKDASSPLSEWMGVSFVALLIGYGSKLVFNGEMQAASFLAFLFAFFRVIDPAKKLSDAWGNLQKGFAALERIEEVLHAPVTVKDNINPKPWQGFNHEIKFDEVSFSYPNSSHKVLENLNFTVKKGQKVALVGPSGAGKTTILDLILRFHDTTAGKITIDGTDIKEFKITDVRNIMSLVSQDPVLFNDSIEENIRFGDYAHNAEEVLHSAQIANAMNFIDQAPGGLQSNVGDRGSKLSGGQRQRLTIARAFYRNPDILLLDEATSALDSESERLVQQAFDNVLQNRTSVIVAHRLSTITSSDLILVLKQGKIIEQGSHSELMKLKGDYSQMVQLQSF